MTADHGPDHGPVRVQGTRFRHADGTPFHPWTTAVPQADPDTLRALAASPFNRVRLTASAALSLDRLDQQIGALGAIGVQAEVMLHGRDIPETVERLARHPHVWWCAPEDPDAQTDVQECDHGHHPLTVHGGVHTDFGAPWITHASLRHQQVRAVSRLTRDLCKPVLADDCGAEGDDPDPDAALSAEELVFRVWEGVCRGGYVAHGEAHGPRPWRAHGGRLRGSSAPRVAFLRSILDEAPPGLAHTPETYDASTLEAPGEYWLQYLGPHRYPRRPFELPGGPWRVDVIDTWNMTVRTLDSTPTGRFEVELPAEPYFAIRIRRA
ncbi:MULTISPECIES: DUF5605 domain-containing protein [Streptomyces]|uniref:DUF5605 domain-containing protein n=1 Tax=Streptomyces lonegramiae TaxID=3075524 RepID=A0ABU2X7D7_9ACTN|nr:DUF5605 domain-containing protein [Streptomyces sp. DSM 41529]MDT0541837.1 DUF5605 domain-containing protein [Streptomyces sp. DSM 41529]